MERKVNKTRIELVNYDTQGQERCCAAAKTCYSSHSTGEWMYKLLGFKVNDKTAYNKEMKTIEKCIKKGHDTITEHTSYTISIENISRICSHQLVRHRLLSVCQQSARYTIIEEGNVYTPEVIRNNSAFDKLYTDEIKRQFETYNKLIELGVDKEDARYILPGAMTSNLVMTCNARELRHFLKLRMCKHAQTEIRDVAKAIFEMVVEVHPLLFKDLKNYCKVCGMCKNGM